MKAITIASLSALALAGAACSESDPKTSAQMQLDMPEPAGEVTPASAPADDGFNLRVPGDNPAADTGDDGFNLKIPDIGTAPGGDGFNLPTDLPTSSDLGSIPEIDTTILEDDAPADAPGDDAIIRLEP